MEIKLLTTKNNSLGGGGEVNVDFIGKISASKTPTKPYIRFNGFAKSGNINFKLNGQDTIIIHENMGNFDFLKENTELSTCKSMFNNCYNLSDLEFIEFDTSKVTDMSSMFNNITGLSSIDVSMFDTSNVTDMSNMFHGCESLTNIDLSKFDTSSLEDMRGMFSGCENLTTVDLSKFDTSSLEDMRGMFSGCENLTTVDLSNFHIKQINIENDDDEATYIDDIFNGCLYLETVKVTNTELATALYDQLLYTDFAEGRSGNVTWDEENGIITIE